MNTVKKNVSVNVEHEDVYLQEVKRAYQAEGLAKIKSGAVSEQSHHLFGLRNIQKLKITYRDVDYD